MKPSKEYSQSLEFLTLGIFFFLSPALFADNIISAILLLFSEFKNPSSLILAEIISVVLFCIIVTRFILSFKIWYICILFMHDEEQKNPLIKNKLIRLLIFYSSLIFIAGIFISIFSLEKTINNILYSLFNFLAFSLEGFLLILYSLQFLKKELLNITLMINIFVLTGLIFWYYQFFKFINP